MQGGASEERLYSYGSDGGRDGNRGQTAAIDKGKRADTRHLFRQYDGLYVRRVRIPRCFSARGGNEIVLPHVARTGDGERMGGGVVAVEEVVAAHAVRA